MGYTNKVMELYNDNGYDGDDPTACVLFVYIVCLI